MSNKPFINYIWVSLLILSLIACSSRTQTPAIATEEVRKPPPVTVTKEITLQTIREYQVTEMPLLPEELGWEVMEYSGLGWYGDHLILLPQYPNGIAGDEEGRLYGLPRQTIMVFNEDPDTLINPYPIPFDDAELSSKLEGFEGFEAIVFIDDSAYLTIETSGGDPMKSFIVRGDISSTEDGIQEIRLDESSLTELPAQNNSRNASYEALTSDGEFIYAFFEQNGIQQNDSPYAIRLDAELENLTKIPIEAINYRLTDATTMDGDGGFWVINYFFPGDYHLAVETDNLSNRYGLVGSHLENRPVERLVRFQLTTEGFVLVEQAPIYLELLEKNIARNWEGLAQLDDFSFLMVTDKFPGSILAILNLK